LLSRGALNKIVFSLNTQKYVKGQHVASEPLCEYVGCHTDDGIKKILQEHHHERMKRSGQEGRSQIAANVGLMEMGQNYVFNENDEKIKQ